MLVAYFCQPSLTTSGLSLTHDKSLLACCKCNWRYIGLLLAYSLQNLSANGKQGAVPEEIFQTLLTNKKRGKMRLRDGSH
jgi:hypothetical protein